MRELCKEYHSRICVIEGDKYDMEKEVEIRDYKVDQWRRSGLGRRGGGGEGSEREKTWCCKKLPCITNNTMRVPP